MRLAGGLGSLFALQVFTRLLTFALNTLLARSLGPSWYAFANVQLQLVTATVLFLPKEGLRRAAQRIYPGGGGAPLAWGMNVAWLSVPAAAAVAGLLVAAAGRGHGTDSEWAALMGQSEARVTLAIVVVAAVAEAAAEPGWVYAQANLLLPQRALAEGAALVAKAAATAHLVFRAVSAPSGPGSEPGSEPSGLGLAFSLAQLAFSCTFLLLLYSLASRHTAIASLAPRRSSSSSTDGDTAGPLRWLPRRQWGFTAQLCLQVAGRGENRTHQRRVMSWPSQDIGLLRGSCARIIIYCPPHPHCPHYCNTIARLLGSIRLSLRTLVCMLYTIQYVYEQSANSHKNRCALRNPL